MWTLKVTCIRRTLPTRPLIGPDQKQERRSEDPKSLRTAIFDQRHHIASTICKGFWVFPAIEWMYMFMCNTIEYNIKQTQSGCGSGPAGTATGPKPTGEECLRRALTVPGSSAVLRLQIPLQWERHLSSTGMTSPWRLPQQMRVVAS